MAVDVGSAVGYLDLDISGFLNSLKTAQSEANAVSNNIATKIGNGFTTVGNKLSSAGTKLTATVTTSIIGLGTAAVKTSSDFETAMSKVSAISGATGDDLDALNKKAQEMGAKTKFSATESAEAFTYMAMAGWKTQDMLEGIEGIMSLAAADGLDLATTSDIVTDALTAFGLSAADSGRFADVLASAASNANTNVSLLGESFKYVAPVAGALGYSAEDTAIALGLMANAGIKGSQGGTALRASISRLIDPTGDAATIMKQYGLSLTNTDGSMKSLREVMDMLRLKMGDLTEAEQAQVASTLFGQEAMSGMLAIINASESDYDKLTNAIYNSDGAAKQMADTMNDNLNGQIILLKSALEGLAIQFGEILLPYLKKFVAWLQELIAKLQSLTPQQREQIVRWGAILAIMGPVLILIGKLTAGIGTMITVFGKLSNVIPKVITGFKNFGEGFALAKAGFSGLAAQAGGLGTKLGAMAASIGPWGIAIVAAIAIVIAAFTSLWKNNEEFRDKVTAIWEQVKATFDRLCQGIVDAINKLGFDFENIGELLKTIWKGFCDFLGPCFVAVFQYISDTFSFFVDIILNTLNFFVSLVTGDWAGCWESIKGIFVSTWNYIVGWFENVCGALFDMFEVVLGWFGTSWSECWSSIKQFFVNIWNGITSFFTVTLSNIISAISQWAVNMATKASQAATNVYNNIVNGMKSLPGKLLEIGKNLVQGLWNGITSAGGWLKDKISSFGKSIINGFKKAFNINSPSKETEALGEFITQGLAVGMENEEGGLLSSVQKIVDDIMNKMNFIITSIRSLLSGSLFPDKETTALDSYNETLLTTLNIYKMLSDQMKLCVQYAKSLKTIDNGLLGFGSKRGTSSFSIFNNADIEALKDLIISILGKDKPDDGGNGDKPDQLVIPISIGDEQIETVIVDLLRREVRV